MYGAAPAKYPAPTPATYPAAPAKYEAPAPPAPAKYETPTTTTAKYEAEKPKYEEIKKEEYPMKMEYKTEEKPAEYKKEEKIPEYGGGKKYRRSIIDDEGEEQVQSDPFLRPIPAYWIRNDPFSMVNDPGVVRRIANAVGNIFNRIWRDESARRNMGLSRKQAKLVREAVMDGRWMDGRWMDGKWMDGRWMDGRWMDGKWMDGKWMDGRWMDGKWMDGRMAAENDPGFGKKFDKALAKESAGSFSDWKYRGGDPFSVTVQDLVQMYGRDPTKGGKYWLRKNDDRLKWWSDDQEMLMDDDMDF
jgi:hypothetical protein